ncbi:hypothetical protein LZ32DRAFT_610850 [Colletotrichum eremochloae]|nr:hypothetical protein LZ32DRAFT_610850 [Colletotrichum eremochloae]
MKATTRGADASARALEESIRSLSGAQAGGQTYICFVLLSALLIPIAFATTVEPYKFQPTRGLQIDHPDQYRNCLW